MAGRSFKPRRPPRRRGRRLEPAVIVLSVLVLAALPAATACAQQYAAGPRVSADAAVLLDPVTGELLYARRPFEPLPPASTTKIMTCLLVLEHCGLDEVVVVSSRASATGGSRIGLRAGQLIAVQDLLVGLMLQSGNDAATALAEHVSGSVEDFAALMTARARSLGAMSTSFVNPHGLPAKGHRSSAYDLAVIARAALRDPVFQTLVASKEGAIGSLHPSWTGLLRNTNKLLWMFSGADGVKTGTTREAGQCLVASATRSSRQLISVVLHSGDRYADSARLLEYGFNHTGLCLLALEGDPIRSVEAVDPVFCGMTPWSRVPLVLTLSSPLAFNYPAGPRPEPEISFSTDSSPPTLPCAAGEIVGAVQVRLEGRIVAVAGMTVQTPVPKAYGLSVLLAHIVRAVEAYLLQGLR